MKHELIRVDAVPSEGSVIVPFFGREVHVWRRNGKLRAAANACLHLGGPLECRDGALVCPWHGARNDMATGARTDRPGPEAARLMLLPVRVEEGALFYVWGE